ncbi:protein-methionine-sulfoxide reductase heme-binding subunit MsrQ [Veronia nyctiphanis]|uniref:Protein-methionine-sulfoxide reductase heme-binding subunit MsrQ n=1 Tax=Veronia nyctiphanis TaxID=1278244 RepID=A0A4Q0YZD0_9GAMM|nr:protein-methionine-sulfoxide reductase heme-binding subunit MsrQ [Veronia nyctiphanis]RXJ74491.1 protein-methionine-sulfoxide reductase heme-binding subunit MsrQ [Veronia nyctiphanis]
MRITQGHTVIIRTFLHIIQLGFLAQLVALTLMGGFGADPIEGLTKFTGIAALNSLVFSLLISPMSRYFKLGLLIKVRRPAGIYSFVWATLHVCVYAFLDLALNVSLLISEIIERPFLTVGFVAWLILLALTVTSTKGMQRRLGRKWQSLHNWVYAAMLLVPVHFYWSSKSELIEPSIYIIVALVLLTLRRRNIKNWSKSLLSPLQKLIYNARVKPQ